MESEGGATGHPVPLGVVDAHRLEHPVVEQLRQTASGDPFHHPGQDARGRVVVGVPGPLGLGERHPQEALDQVVRFQPPGLGQTVGAVPGGHGQQVVHGDPAALRGDVGRNVVGQHVHHPIVQRQEPVGDREPHRDRGERLGQRVEQMRSSGRVRRPPAFGDDVTVAHDHDGVQLHGSLLDPVEQRRDRPGRDPRRRRCRARQQGRRRTHPGTLTRRTARFSAFSRRSELPIAGRRPPGASPRADAPRSV